MEGDMGSVSHRNKQLRIVGIVVLVILVLTVFRGSMFGTSQDDSVTVVGRGKVSYQPDTATIALGVRVDHAPYVDSALKQINAQVSKVVATVISLGIPKENIQTDNYSFAPQYEYPENSTEGIVSGYHASEVVIVKVDKINSDNAEMVAKVIEAAGKAGANEIQGVVFSVANLEELKQQARAKAFEDAKMKSKDIAKAAGVKLGNINGWYETVIASPDADPTTYSGGFGGDDKTATSQIPIGINEVIIDMGVNYKLK